MVLLPKIRNSVLCVLLMSHLCPEALGGVAVEEAEHEVARLLGHVPRNPDRDLPDLLEQLLAVLGVPGRREKKARRAKGGGGRRRSQRACEADED